jgi:hypothetical protein
MVRDPDSHANRAQCADGQVDRRLRADTRAGTRLGAGACADRGGANPNALDRDRYDIVTIAAVANDVPTLALARQRGYPAMATVLERAGAR